MLIARDADQVPSGAVGRRAIVSTGTVGLPRISQWWICKKNEFDNDNDSMAIDKGPRRTTDSLYRLTSPSTPGRTAQNLRPASCDSAWRLIQLYSLPGLDNDDSSPLPIAIDTNQERQNIFLIFKFRVRLYPSFAGENKDKITRPDSRRQTRSPVCAIVPHDLHLKLNEQPAPLRRAPSGAGSTSFRWTSPWGFASCRSMPLIQFHLPASRQTHEAWRTIHSVPLHSILTPLLWRTSAYDSHLQQTLAFSSYGLRRAGLVFPPNTGRVGTSIRPCHFGSSLPFKHKSIGPFGLLGMTSLSQAKQGIPRSAVELSLWIHLRFLLSSGLQIRLRR
ncbi:hypothetical protein AB1N83_007922 [Pleurotus pulmonarius]